VPATKLGGGSSAVAASSHAACARFRGTDPIVTRRSRRQLARELGYPDTSGTIPEARWMRAMAFERLVRNERFASRVATTCVGSLGLPRPAAVVVADAKRDRKTTLKHLARGLAVATGKLKATLIHEPALPFPGFEDVDATDVLPDFLVVAPREDDPDRAWLVIGDAKDYERIRSRISDGRMLKGFLQVALGAEAAQEWSELPDGLDVHEFGVLAVPKNAFLQPQAVVEELRDHRDEVRSRIAERRGAAEDIQWVDDTDPTDFVAHLVATFDPETCTSCSLFDCCRSELRASTDPESLLVELGVPADDRPFVVGLVDGTGQASDAAPPSVTALVTATVGGKPFRTGQCRVDPVGEPGTVNVVVAKSDAAALGVHGLAIQLATDQGRGPWAYHTFGNPQSEATRRDVVRLIGEAVEQSVADAYARNPERPDPIHICVPEQGTADLLASIADALAGVELSRLRWQRDLDEGRPALTFNGEPATLPASLSETERTGVSFLLEEDRARAFSLRTPTVDVRAVLARHVVAGGPAVNSYRLDYLVQWAIAKKAVNHRTLGDAIEASAHTPGARLSNLRSNEIHAALVGPGRRPDLNIPFDAALYERLVREELEYKATTLDAAIDVLMEVQASQLRGAYRAIEGDAQAVWRRRHAFHASDLVRFGRTYRWWRERLVGTIEADGTCHDQLLALTNHHAANEAATDAGARHIACARIASVDPLVLDISSRSIDETKRVVLLHVNGKPCVEAKSISVVHQAGSFKIDGLAVGQLSRAGVAHDAPRTHLSWEPDSVPHLSIGDSLVIADYDWYHTYAAGRYVGVTRPPTDTAAAPTPDCQPDDFQNNPGAHQWCCKPHEAAEAEWSDELARRRADGKLNPETWPPVQDEDGFDVIAVGDPVDDPTADPPQAPPEDATLDDLE
jgi:hypothetical protein